VVGYVLMRFRNWQAIFLALINSCINMECHSRQQGNNGFALVFGMICAMLFVLGLSDGLTGWHQDFNHAVQSAELWLRETLGVFSFFLFLSMFCFFIFLVLTD